MTRSGHAVTRRTHAVTGEGRWSMGWRRSEVWFDIDVLWFNEKPQPAFAFAGAAQAALDMIRHSLVNG